MFKKLNQTACVAMACLLLLPTLVFAGPTGGEVVKGDANISYNGSTTNINQSSQKAAINWQGFSVAPAETVNFNQPNSNAMTLNRVIGNERSVIEGAINANGKVYLINSNGVLFTGTSKVNVGGLVASTLNISDDDFMSGKFTFSSDKNNPASIINQGEIIAANGGYVTLMGGEICNDGLIIASMGTVSLNSGKKVTLNFQGDSLLSATIDEAALEALVSNKGAVIADGGLVIMTAKAAGDILSAQVNNEGLVQARTISDLNGGYQNGEIYLYAYEGTANVAGKLDASAPNGGNGGFIETSGDSVKIADSAVITTLADNGQTGTWLIDPKDFTIAAADGDITGANLSGQLGSNNVVIESQNGINDGNGDIYVNDKVEWDANTTLTLTAVNDIFINNAIKATGLTAGLIMNFGGDYRILTKASYSGTTTDINGNVVAKTDDSNGVYGSISFTNTGNINGLIINGQQYTLLHNTSDFSAINSNLNGYYAIAQNINGGTHSENVVNGTFTGTFAGLGHTINDLVINGSTLSGGFFKTLGAGSTVRDLGIINASVNSTNQWVGILAGKAVNTNVHHVYTTGNVAGTGSVGGLIGTVDASAIKACFAHVTVTGSSINLGGLLGRANNSAISACHATGTVTSSSYQFGGLIGNYRVNNGGVYTLENCYATGDVTSTTASVGGSTSGGLVGELNAVIHGDITVKNSFATGTIRTVSGQSGGLFGYAAASSNNNSTLTIENCHATGSVYADSGPFIGGLIGATKDAVVNNSYATGNVEARVSSAVGGLVGGSADSEFNGCSAYGKVQGSRGVGGFAGELSGSESYSSSHNSSIDNCHAYGDVYGEFAVGGLVGYVYTYADRPPSNISNSSASGDVYVLDANYSPINGHAGALVGSGFNSNINNNSATGSISAPPNTTHPVGGLIGHDLGDTNSSGNTYVDVKAVAAADAAAYAAYKQNVMSNVNAVTNTTEQEARQLAENAPEMTLVADTGKEQQGIMGLSDNTGSDSGVTWGWGDSESEPLTLAMLGMNIFSAQVKIIMTDEGDVYELEATQ